MSQDQPRRHLDLARLRARLSATGGRELWRSLEELAETEEFADLLHREFPQGASEWNDTTSRRRFLTLMGASLALAGLNACSRPPDERIVPYVRAPEEIVPGKPLFFATASLLGGYARGILVESHMGRPTKVEGNPDHPDSLGATDAFAQASVLSLWDPERSQTVLQRGRIATWNAFGAAIGLAMEAQAPARGAGLRLLTGTVTSPTLAAQIGSLLEKFPAAKWHRFEPISRDGARGGSRAAFGKDVDTHYRLGIADVILSLDSDFLACGPGHLRLVREFTDRRRARASGAALNRLYAVEATPGNTGAMADHTLPLRASALPGFARALAAALGAPGAAAGPKRSPREEAWIAAVAKDLAAHRGRSAVIPGEQQPAAVHAAAHALNQVLGNAGATVFHSAPVEAAPVLVLDSLRELVADLDAGRVEVLVICGTNPVYAAPADLQFAQALEKAKVRVHLGLHEDETGLLCHWHLPEAHELESWGDARASDGTVTLLQPLIAPLWGGKSAHEVVAALLGQRERTSYEAVREHWKRARAPESRDAASRPAASRPDASRPDPAFESFWRKALHDGVVPGTALPMERVSLGSDLDLGAGPAAAGEPGLEVVYRPDPTLWDGRFAGSGWLQELPKPVTKLTWDNAALVAPATAERLKLANEDVVEVRRRGRSVRAPVWIVPGQPADSVTLHLGGGRQRAGKIGTDVGFDANRLRTADAPWSAAGVELVKTGERHRLACTQDHHSMEGREHVRTATLADLAGPRAREHGEEHGGEHSTSLYPPWKYEGYAWGMVIDLSVCTGCSACVVACQAENNIPVVGKAQVENGREMHWLRIDRYYEGSLDAPATLFQPLPCMHCENAPCEVVCPVFATAHSSEGLNDMTYNRCVGTRYCSNNCPYKVRRFNFLQYTPPEAPSLLLHSNPNVTIRERGVMEKCTYCVQRINAARIQAKKEDRKIRDGEIVTACQGACPARAIVFGNINDPASEVAKQKLQPHEYGLLAELDTKPRTTYLARVSNKNPELEGR